MAKLYNLSLYFVFSIHTGKDSIMHFSIVHLYILTGWHSRIVTNNRLCQGLNRTISHTGISSWNAVLT